MFRFTIRDVLWLMVVAGLILTLLPQIQRQREACRLVDATKLIGQPRRIATQADYNSLPFGRANP